MYWVLFFLAFASLVMVILWTQVYFVSVPVSIAAKIGLILSLSTFCCVFIVLGWREALSKPTKESISTGSSLESTNSMTAQKADESRRIQISRPEPESAAANIVVSANPTETRQSSSLTVPSGVFAPEPRYTLRGRVQTSDGTTNIPINRVKVFGGEELVESDVQGTFELSFTERPPGNLVIRWDHEDHLPSFRTFESLLRQTNVSMTKKLRVAVVQIGQSGSTEMPSTFEESFQSGLRKELDDTGHIQVVLSGQDKEKVLNQIEKQRDERALYKKETLVQLGKMYAASHCVFISLGRDEKILALRCTVANLSAGLAEEEIFGKFSDTSDPYSIGEIVGKQALAKMTVVDIISPANNSKHGRVVRAQGYSVMQPKGWNLFLALLPDQNDTLFPQNWLTSDTSGFWQSKDVYLGETNQATEGESFSLYPVLADPEYSKVIDDYLQNLANSQKPSSSRLRIKQWDKSRHRLFPPITVYRVENK